MSTLGEGEDVAIPVYNNVDSEQLPSSFRYVTESVYPNEHTDLVTKSERTHIRKQNGTDGCMIQAATKIGLPRVPTKNGCKSTDASKNATPSSASRDGVYMPPRPFPKEASFASTLER